MLYKYWHSEHLLIVSLLFKYLLNLISYSLTNDNKGNDSLKINTLNITPKCMSLWTVIYQEAGKDCIFTSLNILFKENTMYTV